MKRNWKAELPKWMAAEHENTRQLAQSCGAWLFMKRLTKVIAEDD